MHPFQKLFSPRGIAIIGAQPDPTRGGGQTLRALQAYGYAGRIYPVHPRHRDVNGLRCYASVGDIDGPCDVAVVAIPPLDAIEAVRECGRKGIAFAIMYTGAFRVPGRVGPTLEDDLKLAAREANVRLIGPNCLGVVNVAENVYASFGSMSREPRLRSGSVSLVSQSGGFGYSMALRCFADGAGLRYLVSSGNECDITTPELIDACLDDPGTRVVVAYIEGVKDGRALMAAGRKALRLGKPILLWKAGNSEEGKRAAASHTGNVTGSYDIYRAALRQSGIIEVSSFEAVSELVKTFSHGCRPAGRRVSLMSGSGGAATVFADCAATLGFTLPQPTAATLDALRKLDLDIGDSINPMDCAPGFLGDASAPKFVTAVDVMLADPQIDQLCVFLMTILGKPALNGARALAAGAARHGKPILVCSTIPRETALEAYAVFEQAGIPVLSSPSNVALAAAALATFSEMRAQASNAAELAVKAQPLELPQSHGALSETQSKALLARCGVPVSRDLILAPDADDSDFSGLTLSAPYVVKIVSADIPHKTEVGGVRVGVPDKPALKAAINDVLTSVKRAAPNARIDGVMISEMLTDGVEALIGAVNDPVFGPVVAFGLGGIHTEILKDLAYRVAPFDRQTALGMVSELRGRAIFDGVRGKPALDIDAVADILVSISKVVWLFKDIIEEIDINPIIVRPCRLGAVAVDALVVLK